ncbi:putative bifunctional diguanylate cyclase/phosphodiesterase [Alteromonas sp. CYL-A6]|uniref:putative bifunctional diguanylate cyclase/phosphodiesterase n=1 Tax=Alteromonas nitratireducens TaxID=3390813 RepID=UPI0034B30038
MKVMSLRHSLFRILLGGIVITAGLILLSVWNATNDLVERNLEQELRVDTNILQYIVEEKAKTLSVSASVFSSAYEFKGAFATRHAPTINSVLQTMDGRRDFDFLIMLDLQRNVITAYPETIISDAQSAFTDAFTRFDPSSVTSSYVFMGNTLYHAVAAPIEAPRVIGYLGAGFALNDAFLRELSEVVKAEVIISKTTGDTEQVISSSLPASNASGLMVAGETGMSWLDVMFGDDALYEVRTLTLNGIDHLPVKISIALDVSEQYQRFIDLQAVVISISLIAMFVSLAIAMRLSRRVSEPVADLVSAVNNIADGDYAQPLQTSGRLSEIGELAGAFTRMQDRIRSREERIRFQAEHDMLTGLFNRDFVEREISRRLENNDAFQIIGININGFRTINDLYGYTNGDRCLRVIAERLTRWPGMAARLAGGELLFSPQETLNDLQLETLRHILEQPVESQSLAIPIKMSFALIACPEEADNAQEVFRKLNIIADESEKRGRWLVSYEQEMEAAYLRRLTIITELKRVLSTEQSELSMAYQPKIDLRSMTVCSMEALIRWNNRVLGFVPPDEFISIAEQAGLIEQVSGWVIERTLIDLADFRARGYQFTVAINLSTQDIQQPLLLERLTTVIEREGLSAGDIELEITESDLVEDAAVAIHNLNRLRDEGFSFAIDDFGTGYSSLAYLKNLPVNAIKIDKSFVLNLTSDTDDQQIVRTVLHLADVFGLTVVAEGVEDASALQLLKEWGCEFAQGYHISRPLSVSALLEWLDETGFRVSAKEKL